MSTALQKRVWKCMQVFETMSGSLPTLEETFLDERNVTAIVDLEKLATTMQILINHYNKPWWKKLLGW